MKCKATTGQLYKRYCLLLSITLFMYRAKGVYFCGCALVGEVAMARNLLTTSVKLGLSDGSANQHCSISELHCGSHDSGTGGRRVLFTIPPGCSW